MRLRTLHPPPTAAGPAAERLLRGVAHYYAARYREFGDSARGMDWKDAASQRLRFEVLARNLDLSGRPSLLDVGCGNGELLAWLRRRGAEVDYRGIDVCAEMVAACRRRCGEESAALASTADLASLGWTADYVVASGTFNVRPGVDEEEWGAYFRRALREMFAACRVAIVFNVISSRADRRYARLFYLDAAAVPGLADLCGTRRFRLDHDYPLCEMTVALAR